MRAVRTFDALEHPLNNGSAVVVAPGQLVANCHVLAKASSFVIRQDNVTYGATLEYPDVERDLCQISVANFRAAPVTISPPSAARVGQRVYAIGSPRGVENTLNEGMLSGLRGGYGADEHLLQTTAPVSPGSSGGGLFDAEGRLLGIMTVGAGDAAISISQCPPSSTARFPGAQMAMATRARRAGQGPAQCRFAAGRHRTDRSAASRRRARVHADRPVDGEANAGGVPAGPHQRRPAVLQYGRANRKKGQAGRLDHGAGWRRVRFILAARRLGPKESEARNALACRLCRAGR